VRAYVELLRPANVVTALADVLAGYAVTQAAAPGLTNAPTARALVFLLLATACLYAGGVALNDVFDRRVDAVERPERPIPSGRVTASAAALLGSVLLAAGVALSAVAGPAAAAVAAAITASVVLYDGWAKRHAVGPVIMGACRGLNLLLGVAAAPAALAAHWPLGLIGLTYISAVTMVSRGEVHGARGRTAVAAFALVCAILAVLVALSATVARHPVVPGIVAAGLAWRVLPPFWRAARDSRPEAARGAVRAGVLSLVLVDAVIAGVYADMIYCLGVLATAVVAGWLGRRFAVT